MTVTQAQRRIPTGVPGLDDIMYGGLLPERGYMVVGGPGAGKSILGLHYLTAGEQAGETGLYIALEERASDIQANAATLGFDLDDDTILDLSPDAAAFTSQSTDYEVFSPDTVETPELVTRILDTIEATEPDRVFVDPLTRFRQLTPSAHQFAQFVTGFITYLTSRGTTVMFSAQPDDYGDAIDLQFLSDGTITLDRTDHGRRLAVPKFRGSNSKSGTHTFTITDTGITVYPALESGSPAESLPEGQVPSGIVAIDEMMSGGLNLGSVTFLSGPTGVGKTTLGTQFLTETALSGTDAAMYLFEENRQTFIQRSRGIGIPVDDAIDAGRLSVTEIEPLRETPDQFANRIRQAVEDGVEIVMIDGVAGYQLSLRGGDDELEVELATLCRYLKNNGVTTILIDSVDQVTGDFKPTQSNVSYLADTLVFLRYLEIEGELRKAIGLLKRRTGGFERSLREFEITDTGIVVGDPLHNLRGILKGTPEFVTNPPEQSRTP